MNEKFVASHRFIFLEQPAQFYFQITINTTNTSDNNNGYYFSITVTSQFQCNIINTFRSNLYFSFVYLIASCYRAIIGIVGLLDVRCKVLF